KGSSFYWTILRSAPIYGQYTFLMRTLNYWVEKFPVIPVIGSGLNHIQPVAPDDVAQAIFQSLYNKETVQKTYDLVGPRSYSLTDLLLLAAENQGLKKAVVKLPTRLGLKLVELLSKYTPDCQLDPDVVKLMTTDAVSDPAIMQ